MKTVKSIWLILLYALLIVLFDYEFFNKMAVEPIFSIGNICSILIALIYYHVAIKSKMFSCNKANIEKKIFVHSLLIGFVYLAILSFIFYSITGTLLDVEAVDAKNYHEFAVKMANNIKYRHFYDRSLGFGNFDDNGYFHFIAFVYYFTDNSVTALQIVQCVIRAISVVLIYRITLLCFENERAAGFSAIIAIPFPLFLVYSTILLKVTVLVFTVLLSIYAFVNIVKYGIKIKWVVVILVSFLSFATMRFVYILIMLFSFALYFTVNLRNIKRNILQVIFASIVMAVLLMVITGKMGFKQEALIRGTAYISKVTGYEEENKLIKEQRIGGQTLNQNKIYRSASKYGGLMVFIPFSISFPFPNIVKTNVSPKNPYKQTLQWYFIGGILLWNFISYYSIVGMYAGVKKYFKTSSILLFFTAIFTTVLLSGFLITSIRHNVPKVAVLLPFVGVGMDFKFKNKFNYSILYSITMSIVILAYNYFKLKARM